MHNRVCTPKRNIRKYFNFRDNDLAQDTKIYSNPASDYIFNEYIQVYIGIYVPEVKHTHTHSNQKRCDMADAFGFPIIVKSPQQKYKTTNRSSERYEIHIYNASTQRKSSSSRARAREMEAVFAFVRVCIYYCDYAYAREREREMRYLKMVLQGRHPSV